MERGVETVSNDLTYKYRKEEIQKNGSCYLKTGLGKHEKPFMSPYEYGSLKNESKKRGRRK